MGLISIDENTLNDIADALREVNATEQTYTIKNMADGVYMIGAVDDWTWVEDKGRTRMYIDVWDETRLTVTINVRLVGTVNWGDGSEMASYTDEAVTLHTHTYDTVGKYVISLEGDAVQLGDYCMNGDAVCQRYLYQLECGKNCSFSANAIRYVPNLDRVYFSAEMPTVGLNFNGTNIRAIHFNGQAIDHPTRGAYGSITQGIELAGTGTMTCHSLHVFSEAPSSILNIPELYIRLNRTSGNCNWFSGSGNQFTTILHFTDIIGNTATDIAKGMPSYLNGTYFWINAPSNCACWNDNNNITIAANGELHSYNPTPFTINSNTFTMNPGAKIYVPAGSLEAYQAATNWSALADYMEEE